MGKKIPKRTKLLISALLSIVILVFIYRNIDIPVMTKTIRTVNSYWFLLFLALFIPQLLVATLRWNWMSAIIGKVKFPFYSSWQQVVGSYSANLIIPGKMGEVVRVPWMKKFNMHCPVLLFVFIEKLLDIFSIVIIMTASLIWIGATAGLNVAAHRVGVILGLTTIVGFIVLFLFRKAVFQLFERCCPNWVEKQPETGIYFRIRNSLEYLAGRLPLFLLISLTLWAIQILEFYVIFRMFSVDPGIFEVGFGCSLALLAGALPISIAGIGPRDAVIVSYFTLVAPAETLVAISIITILRIIIPALAGLPFFFMQSKK